MEFMGAYRRGSGTSDAAMPAHVDDEHGPAIDDGPPASGRGFATVEVMPQATMSRARDIKGPGIDQQDVARRPSGRRLITLGPVAFGIDRRRWRPN